MLGIQRPASDPPSPLESFSQFVYSPLVKNVSAQGCQVHSPQRSGTHRCIL